MNFLSKILRKKRKSTKELTESLEENTVDSIPQAPLRQNSKNELKALPSEGVLDKITHEHFNKRAPNTSSKGQAQVLGMQLEVENLVLAEKQDSLEHYFDEPPISKKENQTEYSLGQEIKNQLNLFREEIRHQSIDVFYSSCSNSNFSILPHLQVSLFGHFFTQATLLSKKLFEVDWHVALNVAANGYILEMAILGNRKKNFLAPDSMRHFVFSASLPSSLRGKSALNYFKRYRIFHPLINEADQTYGHYAKIYFYSGEDNRRPTRPLAQEQELIQ